MCITARETAERVIPKLSAKATSEVAPPRQRAGLIGGGKCATISRWADGAATEALHIGRDRALAARRWVDARGGDVRARTANPSRAAHGRAMGARDERNAHRDERCGV